MKAIVLLCLLTACVSQVTEPYQEDFVRADVMQVSEALDNLQSIPISTETYGELVKRVENLPINETEKAPLREKLLLLNVQNTQLESDVSETNETLEENTTLTNFTTQTATENMDEIDISTFTLKLKRAYVKKLETHFELELNNPYDTTIPLQLDIKCTSETGGGMGGKGGAYEDFEPGTTLVTLSCPGTSNVELDAKYYNYGHIGYVKEVFTY